MNQKLLGFTPYTLDEREHLRIWVDQAKASHGSGIEEAFRLVTRAFDTWQGACRLLA